MRTTDPRRHPSVAILQGAVFVLAMSGCGRHGISGTGTEIDGSINSGGGQGGSSATAETGGQGGTTDTAGSSGPGRGGNSGGRSGNTVSPREPKAHRPQAISCAGVFMPPEPVNPQGGGCKKHADCASLPNGRCVTSIVGSGSGRLYYCTHAECATDADCGAGKVCFCGGDNAPACFLLGNCQTDADCGGGAGSFCSPAYGHDCGGVRSYSGYYCHTAKDTCIDDGDCTGHDYCDYDVIDGRWDCKAPDMTCVIG